jgi:hypothetical protein
MFPQFHNQRELDEARGKRNQLLGTENRTKEGASREREENSR